MVKGLLVGHAGRRSALVVLLVGALVGGCGGSEDSDPKAKAAQPAKKPAAPTAGIDKPQPMGPSERELAIDYGTRVNRFVKKYRSERRALAKGFKEARTPAAYITVAKRYKRYLNKAAHRLSLLKPPRQIRAYHHRLIVIVRRLNGHMSVGIGGLKQLNLQKLNRFETLIDRDMDKGEKAADTIDNRLRRLIRG